MYAFMYAFMFVRACMHVAVHP